VAEIYNGCNIVPYFDIKLAFT